MRTKGIVNRQNSSGSANQISTRNIPQRGVGRNSLRKSRPKVIKLSKVRGAVLPSLTRLARLPTSKDVQLVNWNVFTAIQNTWRYIRLKHINFLREASIYETSRLKDKIKKFLPNITISSVQKVNNPFLESLYEIKKIEYDRKFGAGIMEKELFHSTRASAVKSIVENNFNWRLVRRSRFGSGTCFSSDADYADCHSNRGNGNSRAFIVTKVLICKKMLGCQNLAIPPPEYDTTTGGRTNEIIYVKYMDNEFLPTFVVYYTGSSPYSSKYNNMPRSWF